MATGCGWRSIYSAGGQPSRGRWISASADIGGQFSANGAQFGEQRMGHEANFNGLKVGQNAFFKNAVFQGPVDFRWPTSKGNSVPRVPSLAKGQEHEANFNGHEGRPERLLSRRHFRGRWISARPSSAGSSASIGAQFGEQDKVHEANFNAMKVGRAAFFTTPSSGGR